MPSNEIVVGANGSVHVAPAGTAAPTAPSGAYGAGWVDLGQLDENGVTDTDGKTITDILIWQSFYPARKIIASRTFSVAFNLRNWNGDTVKLAFGGGTISSVTGGSKYTPPPPATIDERALGVDFQDGTKNYRLIIPTGLVTGNVATKIVRTAAADLPITFDVIGQDGVDPWYLLTDDPAFAS